MIKIRQFLHLLITLLPSAPATAQVITLVNGDSLRGEVVEHDESTVTVRHAVLGELRISRSMISGILPEPTPQVPADSDRTGSQTPTAPQEPDANGEAPHPGVRWRGSVDLGLAGAGGNSESLSSRLAVATWRETPAMDTRFDAEYNRASEGGRTSKNRAEANAFNDWKLPGSPWGFFARGRFEFDEFTNYRLRLSGFAGPSYTLYSPEPLLLRLRAGLGGAGEFHGPAPAPGFQPEALVGVDSKWTISPRQSVFGSFDYLPSLGSAADFRLDLKAGYQLKVDPRTNMLLKAGVANRFTTRGDRTKRNDVDYFLTLGWEF